MSGAFKDQVADRFGTQNKALAGMMQKDGHPGGNPLLPGLGLVWARQGYGDEARQQAEAEAIRKGQALLSSPSFTWKPPKSRAAQRLASTEGSASVASKSLLGQ